MAFESIRYESRDGIARLTLHRPDRLNSFNDAMHAEVREALAALAGDPSARVLLLTGAGRGFCAGQDLSDRAVAPGEAPVDLGASIERNYRPLVLALRSLPVVILTSSREESDLLQTYQQGVNAYVVKPVDFKEFTAAVGKLGCFWALLNELPPERVSRA